MNTHNSARRTRSSSNNRFRSRRPSNKSRHQRNVRKKSEIDPRRFVKAAKHTEVEEYQPQHGFEDFAMQGKLKRNVQLRDFTTPTKIQDKAIPVALTGQDVIGIANTGTGKTAAFLLPLLNRLMNNRDEKALIVAPTRELALQIQQECRAFSQKTGLYSTLLIGGSSYGRQLNELKRRPQIIIGTPGRIKDHIERKTLSLDTVSVAVLDEVDRMLDMGFINDIRMIMGNTPNDRQSLFFSATMDKTIEGLIEQFTNSAVTIMARTAETSDNVEQSVLRFEHANKIEMLHDLLIEKNTEKVLIFGETKRGVERLSKQLHERGFKVEAMHGNKSQGQRQRALRKFRDNHIDILVATDVAARGIDVDSVTHVINYDTPQTYDDYTHRIGRTGRGGKTGHAVTFVAA